MPEMAAAAEQHVSHLGINQRIAAGLGHGQAEGIINAVQNQHRQCQPVQIGRQIIAGDSFPG